MSSSQNPSEGIFPARRGAPRRSEVFERLQLLNLFQGLSKGEFSHITRKVQLNFRRTGSHEKIAVQGSPCDSLTCLLAGPYEVRTERPELGLSIVERMEQPMVIELEALFGMRTQYARSYVAAGEANRVLQIAKGDLRDVLLEFPTIRFNFLNEICLRLQRQIVATQRPTPPALAARFTRFVAAQCLRPAGEKQLFISMLRLSEELNANRLRVSGMLRELGNAGFIHVGRERLNIPSLDALIQHTGI